MPKKKSLKKHSVKEIGSPKTCLYMYEVFALHMCKYPIRKLFRCMYMLPKKSVYANSGSLNPLTLILQTRFLLYMTITRLAVLWGFTVRTAPIIFSPIICSLVHVHTWVTSYTVNFKQSV